MMRGYFTAGGYYGLVNGEYRLFASETRPEPLRNAGPEARDHG